MRNFRTISTMNQISNNQNNKSINSLTSMVNPLDYLESKGTVPANRLTHEKSMRFKGRYSTT